MTHSNKVLVIGVLVLGFGGLATFVILRGTGAAAPTRDSAHRESGDTHKDLDLTETSDKQKDGTKRTQDPERGSRIARIMKALNKGDDTTDIKRFLNDLTVLELDLRAGDSDLLKEILERLAVAQNALTEAVLVLLVASSPLDQASEFLAKTGVLLAPKGAGKEVVLAAIIYGVGMNTFSADDLSSKKVQQLWVQRLRELEDVHSYYNDDPGEGDFAGVTAGSFKLGKEVQVLREFGRIEDPRVLEFIFSILRNGERPNWTLAANMLDESLVSEDIRTRYIELARTIESSSHRESLLSGLGDQELNAREYRTLVELGTSLPEKDPARDTIVSILGMAQRDDTQELLDEWYRGSKDWKLNRRMFRFITIPGNDYAKRFVLSQVAAPDAHVRSLAAGVLWKFRDMDSLGHLRSLANNDRDQSVKQEAIRSIGLHPLSSSDDAAFLRSLAGTADDPETKKLAIQTADRIAED